MDTLQGRDDAGWPQATPYGVIVTAARGSPQATPTSAPAYAPTSHTTTEQIGSGFCGGSDILTPSGTFCATSGE